jgi:hypothetical protein
LVCSAFLLTFSIDGLSSSAITLCFSQFFLIL